MGLGKKIALSIAAARAIDEQQKKRSMLSRIAQKIKGGNRDANGKKR